jgi:hypothetical protein
MPQRHDANHFFRVEVVDRDTALAFAEHAERDSLAVR